mgnify:CR=1 FL=1
METAIRVKNVTKIYRLYDRPIDRLRESLFPRSGNLHKDFYALKNISFDVRKGESVGIIGVNGSGKSTILKIITGVLTPTEGSVEVNGKVSALLELGAGFNMENTGLENIYMNGTMMGFSRKEMDGKLNAILDFADIGDFVYQPVKTYSSGMFVRLAFALAINVEPEILIVDEALSVGDVFFQAKCYHRMDELRKAGTTILMVTHDMSSVLKYCDRTVVLHKGDKVAEGKPAEMVDLYKRILAGRLDTIKKAGETTGDSDAREKTAETPGAAGGKDDTGKAHLMREEMNVNPDVSEYGNGRAEIYDFGITDSKGKLTGLVLKGETFTIKEKIRFYGKIESPIFTFTLKDKKGNDLTGTNTLFEGKETGTVDAGDEYEVAFTQKMDLQGGEYLISMSCTGFEQGAHTVYHRLYDLLNLTVISNKNTVGVYDTNSAVELRKSHPEA